MKLLILFSIVFSISFSISRQSFAINESEVLEVMKDHLLNEKKCESVRITEPFWKIKTLTTQVHISYWNKEDYTLTYSKFGCGLGENGSVVIAPGRTESSVEFYETALDFVERGFSPIYVIDHVSQGFSERLLEDNHKGHIYRFSDYIDAFDSAVENIESDLSTVEGRSDEDESPLFFLSNSMGGAIGVGYFQKVGNNNPFKAASMLGAMIRINYLGFPDGDPELPNGITNPTTTQTNLFTELGVIAQTRVFCKWHGCDAYATKIARETAEEYGSAYVEGRRDFVTAFDLAPEQVMTHSQARYDLKTFLWESDEMKDLYETMGVGNPQLGAPTYQWTKQAAKFNRDMRKDRRIKKMSTMPIMIITGEKDVRSYTPYEDGSTDLSEHTKFCDSIRRVKGSNVCRFLQIDKGFHELHKESDKFRNPSVGAALNHFLNSVSQTDRATDNAPMPSDLDRLYDLMAD